MFGTENLTRLSARKTQLVAESDAIRRELQANCAKLQPVVGWVDAGTALVRQLKPVLLVAAPALGFLAVRKAGLFSGLARRMITGWRWWRVVKAALKV